MAFRIENYQSSQKEMENLKNMASGFILLILAVTAGAHQA